MDATQDTSAEDRASEILFGERDFWRNNQVAGLVFGDTQRFGGITFDQLVADIRAGRRI